MGCNSQENCQAIFAQTVINHQNDLTPISFKQKLNLPDLPNNQRYQMPGIMAVVPQNGGNNLPIFLGIKRQYRNANLANNDGNHHEHHTERQLLWEALNHRGGLNQNNVIYLYTPQPPCFLSAAENGNINCLENYQYITNPLINNNLRNLRLVVFFSAQTGPNARKNIIPTNIHHNPYQMQRFVDIICQLPQNIRQNIRNNILGNNDYLVNLRDILNQANINPNNFIGFNQEHIKRMIVAFNQFLFNNKNQQIQVGNNPTNLIEHLYNSIYGNNRLIFRYVHI